MRTIQIFCCVGLVLGIIGCGSTRTVTPVDKQEGETLSNAKVTKDGETLGKGKTNVPLEQSEEEVTIDPEPGWRKTTITLDESSPDRITVDVPRDHFYRETKKDTNNIANNWINISVSSDQAIDNLWWTKVINAITTGEFELLDYDKSAGYLRTAWKTKTWDRVSARRRFRGTTQTKDPLKWQFRYEIQKKEKGQNQWKDVENRIFPEDLDIIKRIRNQIEK